MGSRSEAARKAWITRKRGSPPAPRGSIHSAYSNGPRLTKSQKARIPKTARKFKGLSSGGWVKRLGKTAGRMSGAPKGLTLTGLSMWLKG